MAEFVKDTFTDIDGTVLSSHTGEIGTPWTKHISYANTSAITGNRLRCNGAENSTYYAAGLPATAEYDVTGTLHKASVAAADQAGIWGRLATNADTGYRAIYYNESAYYLQQVVASSIVNLASYSAAMASGDIIKLQIRDAAKKVFINGIERISSTDNTITAAGRVGTLVRFSGAAAGYHIADISASDPAGAVIGGPFPHFKRRSMVGGMIPMGGGMLG